MQRNFFSKLGEFSRQLRGTLNPTASDTVKPFRFYRKRVALLVLGAAAVIAIFPLTNSEAAPEVVQKDDEIPATAVIKEQVRPVAPAPAAEVEPDVPKVNAKVLLVSELRSGTPIYSFAPQVRWPLASITKLVTAAVALEQFGPDELVEITESAALTEGVSGNFRAGEIFTVRDLVIAMMSVSSNDAAAALAEFYDRTRAPRKAPVDESDSGSVPADSVPISKTAYFTEAMQRFSKRIGMKETVFGDPTGLSPINQTVAQDMAILAQYISLQHPDIFIPSRRKTNIITEQKTKAQRELLNINQFAGREDFVGGKTGYTDEAKGNLLSVFTHNETEYVIVVLGTDNRFSETLKAFEWLQNH